MIEPQVLTVRKLAFYLGRSEKSVRHDLSRRRWDRIPPPIRLGPRTLVWRVCDVEMFLQNAAMEQESFQRPVR